MVGYQEDTLEALIDLLCKKGPLDRTSATVKLITATGKPRQFPTDLDPFVTVDKNGQNRVSIHVDYNEKKKSKSKTARNRKIIKLCLPTEPPTNDDNMTLRLVQDYAVYQMLMLGKYTYKDIYDVCHKKFHTTIGNYIGKKANGAEYQALMERAQGQVIDCILTTHRLAPKVKELECSVEELYTRQEELEIRQEELENHLHNELDEVKDRQESVEKDFKEVKDRQESVEKDFKVLATELDGFLESYKKELDSYGENQKSYEKKLKIYGENQDISDKDYASMDKENKFWHEVNHNYMYMLNEQLQTLKLQLIHFQKQLGLEIYQPPEEAVKEHADALENQLVALHVDDEGDETGANDTQE